MSERLFTGATIIEDGGKRGPRLLDDVLDTDEVDVAEDANPLASGQYGLCLVSHCGAEEREDLSRVVTQPKLDQIAKRELDEI